MSDPMPLRRIDHVRFFVGNARQSAYFYRNAFGLDVADRFDFDDFTLIYLRNSEADFEVELTINKGRTEPYSHGSGLSRGRRGRSRRRAPPAFRARLRAQGYQGVPPRRGTNGEIFLHRGSRRVQD